MVASSTHRKEEIMSEKPLTPASFRTDPIAWVKRVNQSWFVRGGLKASAAAWLDYLAEMNDGRLLVSCEAARRMCGKRKSYEDPKPWFYAGLFHLSIPEEARRFLSSHHVTLASLPCMVGDPTESWLAHVSADTRELVQRLRDGLAF